MMQKNTTNTSSKEIPMSKGTEERLSLISKQFGDAILFPEKVNTVKKILSGLESLPV